MRLWLAAWRAHPSKRFDSDSLLGDDIVIADNVACSYESIISDAEVTISKDQSLVQVF